MHNLPTEGDLREQALMFEKNSIVIPHCQISVKRMKLNRKIYKSNKRSINHIPYQISSFFTCFANTL